jgi:hypothetical protein
LSGASDELTIMSQALMQLIYSSLFIIGSDYSFSVFVLFFFTLYVQDENKKRTGVSNCDVFGFVFD